jgi:ATP-dependent Clp protease protease subunit
MLYPRTYDIDGKETLVDDTQMCSYKEHMTQEHRILFFSGPITGEMAPHDLLMSLDTLSHDPIRLVITSPGGDLDSTFLFYDTMRLIQSPIETVGRYCASAAAILLAAGSKRYIFPHAKVMLHLPAGNMGGDSKDWDIQHKQMESYRDKVVDILVECGATKSREEILSDIDRDYWLEPAEAIRYGLCDEIMSPAIWQSWNKEEG